MRQLISSDESLPTDTQPIHPCADCPWSRNALPGWLGGPTVDGWLAFAHSDDVILCHTLIGPQCAGVAIYRANVAKLPRDPDVLRLPADRERVFASPNEFRNHHEGGTLVLGLRNEIESATFISGIRFGVRVLRFLEKELQ